MCVFPQEMIKEVRVNICWFRVVFGVPVILHPLKNLSSLLRLWIQGYLAFLNEKRY